MKDRPDRVRQVPSDRRDHLASLLRVQHGVVCRRQLLELGFRSSWIGDRLACGEFVSLYSGVYAIGHDRLTRRGIYMAAVLAGGPNANLSHRSAAHHWGFASPGPMLEVVRRSSPDPRVVPRRPRSAVLDRLVIHRSRVLDGTQTTEHLGIPVTTVARTLLNLAGTMELRALESCLSEAERLRLIRIDELRAASTAGRGWPGIAKLRTALAGWDPHSLDTRSELEAAFVALCRTHDVPTPLLNVLVAGLEVDCLWPTAKLVVELDGFSHHRGRAAFERDRERDLALSNAGYIVIRLTHRQLTSAPSGVASKLKRVLETRRG